MTPKQVAEFLQIAVRTVWRWCTRNTIEHVRRNAGGGTVRYLIPKRAVLAKLEVPKQQPLSATGNGVRK